LIDILSFCNIVYSRKLAEIRFLAVAV
jgi:hypothetical protein